MTQSNKGRFRAKGKYNGERLTIPEMSRRFGIKRSTLSMRIYKYGWSVREAVELPVCARRVTLSQ